MNRYSYPNEFEMSNLYLPTTQSRLSVSPTEFFGTPAYECLQPFLNSSEMELCLTDPFRKACAISAAAAVAAAAAEQTVQPNFHAYSAYYYDAMMSTRETGQCLGLYSDPSTLAAAIMSKKTMLDHMQCDHEQQRVQIQPNNHVPLSSSVLSTMAMSPSPSLSLSRVSELYPPDLSVSTTQTPHLFPTQIGAARLKTPANKRMHNKQSSPRPHRAWSCQCSCPTNPDWTGDCSGGGRAVKIHSIEHTNPIELDMFENVGSGASLPPFECAKSFIRRRNARERERVRCVNAGYELLRRRLPLASMSDRRLAKVEILRGAISYINSLKDLLEKTP
ncbi:unnamed protein product [Echinostoma caproni]|uniref:BHLH domain-containing protein n=1 Tax=Echinostoma caproni TaxID=27848 RepID=A0A183AE87_9TREM|nr:unnamed protein product [Echinostoma caproni]